MEQDERKLWSLGCHHDADLKKNVGRFFKRVFDRFSGAFSGTFSFIFSWKRLKMAIYKWYIPNLEFS